jgi:hypothetical protein
MASLSRSGPLGRGGRAHVKVGRVGVLGQLDDRVLEGQERPGVDLQAEVKVERATAPLLGMKVDLPRLAQRVGLDEVSFVVHVEAVVDCVILELRHISSHIDDGHDPSGYRRTRPLNG